MSSSRLSRRRIMRRTEGVEAASASLLVEAPVVAQSGAAPTGPASVNDLIEQARQEGWQEGYRSATTEMAAAETAGRAAQLRRIADAAVEAASALGATRHEVVSAEGAEAAELAYSLAEAFLQRELVLGRSGLDAVVRALDLAPDEDNLVIRLHPDEVISPDDLRDLVPDATVKIVADPRVEVGGCVLQAGPCRIDTQLGSALGRVRDVLAEFYPDAAALWAVAKEVA